MYLRIHFVFVILIKTDKLFRLDKLKQRGIKDITKTTREKPPPLLPSFSNYFPLSAFFSQVAIITTNYILSKDFYFKILVGKFHVIKILRWFIETKTDNADVKNVHSYWYWQRPTAVNEKFKIQNSMNKVENFFPFTIGEIRKWSLIKIPMPTIKNQVDLPLDYV